MKTALEVGEVNKRLTATFEALGDHAGAGKETLAFLNELSSELPQSRDQLAKWATQYQALGITDLGELRAQIKATASAQAIGGDEAASAYEHLTQKVHLAVEEHKGLKLGEKTLVQLYKAGINATDIADRLGISTNELGARLKAGTIDAQKFANAMTETLLAKGKGPLEAMSNEVGTLEKKAYEAFSHLFDGIDASPITDAAKNIIGLFNLSTPTGEEMKNGIGGGIQAIVNWLGQMMTEAEITFLNIGTWVLLNKRQILDTYEAGKRAVKDFAFELELVVGALEKVWNFSQKMQGGIVGGVIKLGQDIGLAGAGVQAPGAIHPPAGNALPGTAQAHAEGGTVMQPAPGELFASVAPGEIILPQRQARELTSTPPANENGGGGVNVDHLEIHIVAPHGVTDAQSLSITGLSLAFERLQLASGR